MFEVNSFKTNKLHREENKIIILIDLTRNYSEVPENIP
jgi:hypothetical protein